MKSLKYSFLLALLSCGALRAAELHLIGKRLKAAEIGMITVDLRPASSPDTVIRGAVDGPTKIKFKELEKGTYYIVIWGGMAGWDGSPVYDDSVTLATDDIVEHHIKGYSDMKRVELTTDVPLKALFIGYADAVPCKLQRIEHGVVVPFGYRWSWLEPQKNGSLVLTVAVDSGNYIVSVPTLPFDRETGQSMRSESLLSFPVSFVKKGQIVKASVMTGFKAEAFKPGNLPVESTPEPAKR